MLAEHDMIWAKFKMKQKLWRGNMNDSSLKHSHKIHGSRFTLWEKHNQTFYVTRSRGPGVPRLVVYLYLPRLEKGHTANPRCTLLLDHFRHQRHQFRLQTERETKVCWSWVRIFNLPNKNKSLSPQNSSWWERWAGHSFRIWITNPYKDPHLSLQVCSCSKIILNPFHISL